MLHVFATFPCLHDNRDSKESAFCCSAKCKAHTRTHSWNTISNIINENNQTSHLVMSPATPLLASFPIFKSEPWIKHGCTLGSEIFVYFLRRTRLLAPDWCLYLVHINLHSCKFHDWEPTIRNLLFLCANSFLRSSANTWSNQTCIVAQRR